MHFKKILLALSMLLVLGTKMVAQQGSVIKGQALEMVRALQKKDFGTFTKYMHPKAIEMAGGHQKLMQQMDTINVMARQFGAEIKSIVIGNPGAIVKYKNELQTTLPQTSEMTSAFGNVSLESTLVAISDDGGKNWKFIDTMVSNMKNIRKAMPELSPDLIVPPPKAPKFTPKQ